MSAYLPYRPRVRTVLTVADFVGLGLAAWVAHVVRFGPEAWAAKWWQLLSSPVFLVVSLTAAWALAVAAELYEPEVLHRRREVILRVMVAIAAWAMTQILVTYLHPGWAFGRGLLLLTAGGWAALMISSRWMLTIYIRRRRSRFPALVVGEPEAVARFCAELSERPTAPWLPVDGADVPLDEIHREIEQHGASIAILAGGHEHSAAMGPALAALHFSGVPVVAASEVWAWLEERLPLEAMTPGLFLHQPGFGAVHWTLFNRLTRIADIVLALLMLLAATPILLVASLCVLIADGRPVLYRQERAGQYGRSFTMLKMRTMTRDAEAGGPRFSGERDPRVTRVGAVLRRFRIDELPQLTNVLKGEMSLVGPRPERPAFVAALIEQLPYYSFRLAVPPGLSGWAQVNTRYAATLEDHRRKLEFDLYFIRERSMRLYLMTLLRTLSAALVGAGRSVQPGADADQAQTPVTGTLPLPSSRQP